MGQKRYKYLRVYYDYRGLRVRTPHKEVVEWIMSKVKERVPHAKLEVGEGGYYRVHKLGGRDDAIGNWILEELCKDGWEPFAISIARSSNIATEQMIGRVEAIHLRFSYHSEE